jgi:hypothetical protein
MFFVFYPTSRNLYFLHLAYGFAYAVICMHVAIIEAGLPDATGLVRILQGAYRSASGAQRSRNSSRIKVVGTQPLVGIGYYILVILAPNAFNR